jgi:hypothetical protein
MFSLFCIFMRVWIWGVSIAIFGAFEELFKKAFPKIVGTQ